MFSEFRHQIYNVLIIGFVRQPFSILPSQILGMKSHIHLQVLNVQGSVQFFLPIFEDSINYNEYI